MAHEDRVLEIYDPYFEFTREMGHSPDQITAATLTAFTAGPGFGIPRAGYFKFDRETDEFQGHMWKGPFTESGFDDAINGTEGVPLDQLIRAADADVILKSHESEQLQTLMIPSKELAEVVVTSPQLVGIDNPLTSRLSEIGVEVYGDAAIMPLWGKKSPVGFFWMSGLRDNGHLTPELIKDCGRFSLIAQHEILSYYREQRVLKLHKELATAQALADQTMLGRHLLGNRFATMGGFLRSALARNQDPELTTYLEIAFSEEQFAGYVADSLSKLYVPLHFNHKSTDLVERLETSFQIPPHSGTPISYQLTTDDDIPDIYTSHDLIDICMGDLKYLTEYITKNSGDVTVSLRRQEGSIRLTYTLPASLVEGDQEIIFGNPSDEKRNEYWLFYNVAKKIIEGHKGSFNVDYGESSTIFDITLSIDPR